jgi:hypothetical protein
MSKNTAKQRAEQLQGWLSFIKAETIRKGKQKVKKN